MASIGIHEGLHRPLSKTDYGTMRIAVVGATGAVGRHLTPRLVERGHEVVALVRPRSPRKGLLESYGVRPVTGDIFDRRSLASLVEGCDAVVNVATAIPKPDSNAPPDWSLNDRIRREGTENLLDACLKAGVARFVQQSIALLQATGDDRLTDENSIVMPNPVTQSAFDMEAMVMASGLDWRILRGGLYYGPGTGRDRNWREAARRGELTIPGEGADYLSLIHVSDMAEAFALAIGVPASGKGLLLDVVDDEPVTFATLFTHIAAVENAGPVPMGGPPMLPSFRVTNTRARQILAWQPHFRTYKAGIV